MCTDTNTHICYLLDKNCMISVSKLKKFDILLFVRLK